jgi:hypothetical protein
MGIWGLIKNLINILNIVLPIFKNNKNNIIIILISVFISVGISEYKFNKFKNLPPTISYSEKHRGVINLIDQNLLQLGQKSFISWIQVEKIKNNYIIFFQDVRGIIPNGNSVISLETSNDLYSKSIKVDLNTVNLIENLKEFEICNITKEQAINNGYNTIFYILDNTNLKLDYIKFLIVKKEKNIIWMFSLYTENTIINENMKNSNLDGIARFAKREILE